MKIGFIGLGRMGQGMGARLLGGYCGTTPGHIAAIVGLVAAL